MQLSIFLQGGSMKVAKGFKLLSAMLFITSVASFAWGAGPSPATPGLSNADCAKCHPKPAAAIEAKGMAHKTAIGCVDCHIGHPPAVAKKDLISKCTTCHTAKAHYKVPNCLSCHRNPHSPKVINFGRDVTDACLSCHTKQIEQLKANPSKHGKLNCSF